MFTILKKLPLAAPPPAGYTGMAFDGTHFFFARACECKIYQYGRRFGQECCFDTCRAYGGLCYDPKEHCFWAFSDDGGAALFKLNSSFQEIDRLPIDFPGRSQAPGRVTGLSYNRNQGALVVAFAAHLVSVDPNRQEDNAVLLQVTGEWIVSVLCLPGYLVCGCINGSAQSIRIFSMGGEPLKEYGLSCAGRMEAAVALPPQNGYPRFAALISKRGCYPYVWICTMEEKTDECPANGPYDGSLCGEEPPCLPEASGGEKPTGCREEYSGILDSLAMLEKALSHILETEGDKLQKILTTSGNPEELIEANRSIQDVIVQATHLEHVIYDILESLEEHALPGEGGGR